MDLGGSRSRLGNDTLDHDIAARPAIQDVLDRVPTTHANKLASLMTLNFQEFDDVSLLAA